MGTKNAQFIYMGILFFQFEGEARRQASDEASAVSPMR